MFYVYAHFTPCGRVFYIGKGSGRRCSRSSGRNVYWNNIVNKHGGFNFRIMLTTESEEFAYFIEEEIISKLRSMDVELANIESGGKGGCSGIPRSDEVKSRISESAKGRCASDLSRQKMSEAQKVIWSDKKREEHSEIFTGRSGRSHTNETRAKMSRSREGVKKSKLHAYRVGASRAIPVISSDGMIYEDARAAQAHLTDKDIKDKSINGSLILRVCDKHLKTAYGKTWSSNLRKAPTIRLLKCSNGMKFKSPKAAAQWLDEKSDKKHFGTYLSKSALSGIKAYGFNWSYEIS